MKLRIRGNSIRLRLTKGEVEQLAETGKVVDAVAFGPTSPGLRYELRTMADSETRARFEDNCLSVSIPTNEAQNWIRSEQIGIEAVQPIDGNIFLPILVEKDFVCLKERDGEDDTDAFPNPFMHGKC